MGDKETGLAECVEYLTEQLLAGEPVMIEGSLYQHSDVVQYIWESDIPAINATDMALMHIENGRLQEGLDLLKEIMKGRTANFVETKLGIIK
jgi:hypothetical protein